MPISTVISMNPITQTYIKLLILLGFLFAAYAPILPELYHNWMNDPNNSHGILVPLISLYFVWIKRRELKNALRTVTSNTGTPLHNSGSQKPTASKYLTSRSMGLLITIFGLILYIISFLGAVAVSARLSLVIVLIGLIIFNLGINIFNILIFPLFLLFFMVPVPTSIVSLFSVPLQLFVSKVSAFIIQLLSIPAYREGNMLYFASTQLEVAEACSGIRSIFAYLMLGTIFAYLIKRDCTKRWILLVSTIPLAIFVNMVRVTGTGILAHFFGGQVALGFLHEFSGMAIFIFGFVLLFIEYRLLDRSSHSK